jgi:hypothetical protein
VLIITPFKPEPIAVPIGELIVTELGGVDAGTQQPKQPPAAEVVAKDSETDCPLEI